MSVLALHEGSRWARMVDQIVGYSRSALTRLSLKVIRFGLATTGGGVGSTGIAELTLGGADRLSGPASGADL